MGRPTAVVVTTEFRHEALTQCQALGMPDLAPAVIDHPISTLTDTEIDRRADQALSQCIAAWIGK